MERLDTEKQFLIATVVHLTALLIRNKSAIIATDSSAYHDALAEAHTALTWAGVAIDELEADHV